MTRSLAWLPALAVACSGAESATPPAHSPLPAPPAAVPAPSPDGGPHAPAEMPSTAQLLGAMGTLAGLVPEPAYVDDWAKRIDGGDASLDAYIDEILGTQRFAAEVMPSLLFGAFVNVRNYYALPSSFVLKHPPEDVGPLYLRAPCTESEAIAVKPWWSPTTEIKVCPDAYRPEKWTLGPDEQSYRTKMLLSCDSQVGSPELETKSLCGCGPNLIRCLRDEDQYNELNRSLMEEVKQTTRYIVEHDLPMASLFTGNATFRDRNAQRYYLRQKIGALEIKDPGPMLAALESWPDNGQWAPREELAPGQHAGVLTAPQILHWLPDRRQRQRGYYEMLWCNMRNSFGATTHKVLELNTTGNIAFVHDSWKRLAHTELCTNCHARLDYGFQFFLGYPDSRASTYFAPALQVPGKGKLYGRDIDDLRGEAPLTPNGFATLATAQPDFKSCMARHFVSYVLGERATAADTLAIETAVSDAGTFKPPMKVALELYAKKWRDAANGPPEPKASIASAAQGPKGGLVMSPPLHATLVRLCGDCHDKTPYSDNPDANDVPFDLTGGELPRALVVAMLDRVAFGMMPKDAPLDAPEREDLVRTLVDALWSDPAARAEANRYYIGRALALPAQQIDNALHAIDQRARSQPNLMWGALERGIWSDQSTLTPGFLATTALEALRACQASGKTSGKLDDCLSRSLSLDTLSRWPRP